MIVAGRGIDWRSLKSGLGRCWRALLMAHAAFAALRVALLVPMLGLVVRFLLALGGSDVVADQDIAWFLLSPLGVVALIVVTGLALAMFALELAALTVIAAGAIRGHRIGVLEAVSWAAAMAGPLLLVALRVAGGVLLRLVPFLAVAGAAAWLLITDHDINYYLAARPAEFVAALSIAAVSFAAAAVLIVGRLLSWSLAIPLVLFTDRGPRAALAESASRMAGRRLHLLSALAGWALAGLFVTTLAALVVDALGSWLVPQFFDSLRALAGVIGALLVVAGLLSLVASGILVGGLAALLAGLYEAAGPGSPERLLAGLEAGPRTTRRSPVLARAPVLIAAGALLALVAGAWLLATSAVPDRAVVVAHRGAAGRAPENTLASVQAAIEDGADWIEIDVQESADGEVVVIHDSDFMKLAGQPLRVWEGSLAQLQAIDVGSWYAPEYAGERVPTLSEVLARVQGSRARLMIELKYYGHDDRLEQRVIEAVESADMADRVAVMSLSRAGVAKFRGLRPDWETGLLVARAIGNLERIDVDFLAVNTGMATRSFVRRAQRSGRRVLVWTVNDPVSMSRMMSLGVDGVITDEPALAREVLSERAEMGTSERLLVDVAMLFGRPAPRRIYRDESP